MNYILGFAAFISLLFCVVACDSPPWARCIIANETQIEMKVRFSTQYPVFAKACTYSPEDWSASARSCSPGTEIRGNLEDRNTNKWLEAIVPAGGAVEIDRYRYPDIEQNPEENFSIDEIEIGGSSGNISWAGRKEIFGKLHKEGDVPWWPVTGNTPRFVYYYK